MAGSTIWLLHGFSGRGLGAAPSPGGINAIPDSLADREGSTHLRSLLQSEFGSFQNNIAGIVSAIIAGGQAAAAAIPYAGPLLSRIVGALDGGLPRAAEDWAHAVDAFSNGRTATINLSANAQAALLSLITRPQIDLLWDVLEYAREHAPNESWSGYAATFFGRIADTLGLVMQVAGDDHAAQKNPKLYDWAALAGGDPTNATPAVQAYVASIGAPSASTGSGAPQADTRPLTIATWDPQIGTYHAFSRVKLGLATGLATVSHSGSVVSAGGGLAARPVGGFGGLGDASSVSVPAPPAGFSDYHYIGDVPEGALPPTYQLIGPGPALADSSSGTGSSGSSSSSSSGGVAGPLLVGGGIALALAVALA